MSQESGWVHNSEDGGKILLQTSYLLPLQIWFFTFIFSFPDPHEPATTNLNRALAVCFFMRSTHAVIKAAKEK